MLFLLFQLGNDRYAIEASRVVEVVPLLELKKIPHAPRGIAGIFNYRGSPVPALDLCEVATESSARERLSTRIIIIRHRPASGAEHLLGIIAEKATETLRKNPGDFVDSGLRITGAPYLGPVLMDPNGAIQWINEQHLFPKDFRELIALNSNDSQLQLEDDAKSHSVESISQRPLH
jgi:chemotaxis-related protein WspB